MRKVISVITPCYNEEDGIAECYEAVKKVFETSLPDYAREHIFCDNCSTDRTVEILKGIAERDPEAKIIINSRNFGILKNTYNGVMAATGDGVILFMPADLQDPPELIPEFVKQWENGYEVVFGIRAHREEPFFLRTARHIYYRVISRLSYIEYPPDVGDFQLIDRKVHDAMRNIDDAQPFMRMMPFECGYRAIGIPYTWKARQHGLSRNGLMQLIDQGMNGLISFSNAPVRLALASGMIIAALSIVYAAVVIILKLMGINVGPQGVPTIVAAIFFFGAVQLIFLGVMGEYIVAIYNQVRRRPLVVERERVNFEGETPRSGAKASG